MAASDPLADDLAAYVNGYEESWDEEEPPGPPEDLEEAHKQLRRLRWRERELGDITARAEVEIAPIRAWADDRSAGLKREIARIERSLAAFMLTRRMLTGRKTEKFPSGELRAWDARPRLVVLDDEAAVDIIEPLRPEWVRTRKEIIKAQVSAVSVPGERIEGPEPPPDGYEWRAVMEVHGWEGFWLIARPLLTTIPHMALLWPTRPTFSYKTTQPKRETPDA